MPRLLPGLGDSALPARQTAGKWEAFRLWANFRVGHFDTGDLHNGLRSGLMKKALKPQSYPFNSADGSSS